MGAGKYVAPTYESGVSGTEYPLNIDRALAILRRLAGGFNPSQQDTPTMQIRVDAGALWKNGTLTEVSAQTAQAVVAPTTNPRYDRVCISENDAALLLVQGTEAASPVPPAVPVNYLPCALIGPVQTSTTSITNALITDERIGPPLTPRARGALVYRSSVQSIPNTTATAVAFNAESYDTDLLHSVVTDTDRLTVPAGVTKVRVSCAIKWAPATGNRSVIVRKNGSINSYPGQPTRSLAAAEGDEPLVSPVLSVTAGDYFSVWAYQETGGAVNVLADSWAALEILE
jgi:hypothetical protein